MTSRFETHAEQVSWLRGMMARYGLRRRDVASICSCSEVLVGRWLTPGASACAMREIYARLLEEACKRRKAISL